MSLKLLPARLFSLARSTCLAGAIGAGTVLVLLGCGGDGDVVAQADRATEPTAIPAPSDTDPTGQALTLTVVDGGEATGLVMTDHRGRAVYGATGETIDALVCIDDCTSVWIPLASRGNAVAPELDVALFDVLVRPDGIEQVTYNDVPLYTWTGDSDVGITGGAGVAGIWFALTTVGGYIAS